MVNLRRLLVLGLLMSGSVQAACPDALLNKVCNEDNIGTQRSCLYDLKRQLEACIQGSQTTIQNADRKVSDTVKAKRDSAVGALDSSLSQGIDDGRRVTDAYKAFESAIKDLKNEYADFTKEFFANYKSSENDSARALEEIAKQLSTETIPELVEAQNLAIKIGSKEQDLVVRKASTANLLTFKANYIQAGLDRYFAGLSGFMKEKGLADLQHPFDEILPSLASMSGYLKARGQRYQKLVSDLDADFVSRLEVVKRKNVDAAIGEKLKSGAYLSKVAQFMGEVESARADAFKEDPVSPFYKVPTYGGQYERLRNFMAYASICDNPSSAKWTESGCLTYKRNEANAKRLYIGVGLSNLCIQDIANIRSANPSIPEELFTKMRELHSQKKFPEVISLHDSLLSFEPKP